jgi:hypothetical protein
LPEPAEEMVVTLRDFSTNPAHALIDLADEAGVPAVQEIRDDLPDYIEGRLEGWINDRIAKLTIGGVPVTQAAGDAAQLAQTALSHFALDSELAVTGGSATHTLETLDLTPAGLSARYSLSALPTDLTTATATCTTSSGTLTLGDHGYALPYGEYAWRALNEAAIAKYGMDLRAALGAAVDCPSLAHAIATTCYLGYCVGHEPQLTEICEVGLDRVVDVAHAKIAELRFDAIHFAQGSATLVDITRDGVADRMDHGTWSAEINAGQGLRPAPATFTATR